MAHIFLFVGLLLLVGVIIIAIGVGIGFILSSLIPGVGIGMGIIAGAIFSIGLLDFLIRFLSKLDRTEYISNEYEDLEFEDPYIVSPQQFWRSSNNVKKRKKRKNR